MPESPFTTDATDFGGPYDTYNDRLALATAECSMAVYHNAETYRGLCCGAGFTNAELLDAEATQIGIAWTPETIVVTARGSSESGDWLDNALVWRRGWRPVLPRGHRVNLGLRRQLQRLDVQLLERVGELKGTYPEARLLITGHSLGGALVPMIVARLAGKGLEIDAAYAHEMPRTGNRRWAEWYDQQFGRRTFRVVNLHNGIPDVITRVPKRNWGYRHLGQVELLDSGGRENEGKARRNAGTTSPVDLWRSARKENPISSLTAIQTLRDLRSGVKAHFGDNLLEALRLRLAWATEPDRDHDVL